MDPELADNITSAYDVGKLEDNPQPQEPQLRSDYARNAPWYIFSSQWMASQDCAAFRRFGDLNMLNLICLQTELLKLRGKFYASLSDGTEERFRAMDKKSLNDMKFVQGIELDSLLGAGKEEDLYRIKQTLLEIRLKLKEYSERKVEWLRLEHLSKRKIDSALFNYAKLRAFNPPRRDDSRILD
jgi:hypothetical protein